MTNSKTESHKNYCSLVIIGVPINEKNALFLNCSGHRNISGFRKVCIGPKGQNPTKVSKSSRDLIIVSIKIGKIINCDNQFH